MRRFELMLSPAIFDEYQRTCERLAASRPGLEYEPILTTLVGHGTLVADVSAAEPITSDPDDDKFMVCAHQVDAVVVSGDKHLLDASGWNGVDVLRPRTFLESLPVEGS